MVEVIPGRRFYKTIPSRGGAYWRGHFLEGYFLDKLRYIFFLIDIGVKQIFCRDAITLSISDYWSDITSVIQPDNAMAVEIHFHLKRF